MQGSAPPSVDELDTRIINCLIENARATNRDIAKVCDVTEVTIANRLRRLIDNDILKIFPVFDWNSIGYKIACHIYLDVAKRSPFDVAEVIYKIAGVLTVTVTFGPANIVILVLATCETALYDTITQIEDISGVSSVRVEPVHQVCLYRSSSIRLPATFTDPGSFPSSNMELDELDRRIIGLLQENGRFSNREIARRLSVHDAKIRARIRRMEDGGLMALRAMIDPKQPGRAALPSYLLLIATIRAPEKVAERLMDLPNFTFVAVTQARFEVVAVTSQTEISEVNRILHEEVWADDVRSVQTFVIATFYKAVPDLLRII